MYKVIGLREEKYIGKTVSGHNCDFEYTDTEMTRHVVLLTEVATGNKVELTLEVEEGECGSGWCSATYGTYKWDEVTSFAGKTHKIKSEVFMDINEGILETGEDTFQSEVFDFSSYGGCCYYPSGYYSISEECFEPI